LFCDSRELSSVEWLSASKDADVSGVCVGLSDSSPKLPVNVWLSSDFDADVPDVDDFKMDNTDFGVDLRFRSWRVLPNTGAQEQAPPKRSAPRWRSSKVDVLFRRMIDEFKEFFCDSRELSSVEWLSVSKDADVSGVCVEISDSSPKLPVNVWLSSDFDADVLDVDELAVRVRAWLPTYWTLMPMYWTLCL